MCIYEQQGDTLTATERPLYGSKRLGVLTQKVEIGHNGILLGYDSTTIGNRTYELTDHLGNVMATVLDRKILGADSVYRPVVVSYTDYYPFGFPMSERSASLDGYRYGFNGQESDNEFYAEKQLYTAEFWQYDSRLGRRWNVDPVYKEFESPYACFAGNPMWFVDKLGADTAFSDNQARQDFMTAYNAVNNTINDFKSTISNYEKQLSSGTLNRLQTRKINRAKTNTENDLIEWNKLKSDFETLLSDKKIKGRHN